MDANTPGKIFFLRCYTNICDDVNSASGGELTGLGISAAISYIISPKIRSEVGKQGSVQTYFADFYRNVPYFLKYRQNTV